MPPAPPRLASLGGDLAPPEMASDLALVATLPERARRHLWEALGPSLAEPLPPAVEARLDRFCRDFELDGAALARALKACRHLVRAAASLDLDAAHLASDVALLASEPDAPSIQQALLAGYDAARAVVRAENARRTLADHEDLVIKIAHRCERVVASSHGAGLDLPLLALTFTVRRDGREERVTVRLPPDQVEALRRKLPPP